MKGLCWDQAGMRSLQPGLPSEAQRQDAAGAGGLDQRVTVAACGARRVGGPVPVLLQHSGDSFALPTRGMHLSTRPPGLLLETSISPASSHWSPKLTAPNWALLYSAVDGMSSLLKASTEARALQGARPGGHGDKGNEGSASLVPTLSAARGGGSSHFFHSLIKQQERPYGETVEAPCFPLGKLAPSAILRPS